MAKWSINDILKQILDALGGGTSGQSFLSPSSTGTFTQVASLATNQLILAANANRKGGTIFNTDTNTMFIRLSSVAATTTAFTASIATNGYYEIPSAYTGPINAIWAADGAGNANVTEFT